MISVMSLLLLITTNHRHRNREHLHPPPPHHHHHHHHEVQCITMHRNFCVLHVVPHHDHCHLLFTPLHPFSVFVVHSALVVLIMPCKKPGSTLGTMKLLEPIKHHNCHGSKWTKIYACFSFQHQATMWSPPSWSSSARLPEKKGPSVWIYVDLWTSGVHFCGKCAKHAFSGVPRQQQTYYDGSNPANHVGYI